MTDFRIALHDPSTGEIWDDVVRDHPEPLHEARRTFATRFVEYSDYVNETGAAGFVPKGTESDYMDELVRVGTRFDLLAFHPTQRDFRQGWYPDFAQQVHDDGIGMFEPPDTVPVLSTADALLSGTQPGDRPLLILVHPGSLMGSYGMNWEDAGRDGKPPSHMATPPDIRTATAGEVLEFDGDLAAILGDFSDELVPHHPQPGAAALVDAMTRIGRDGVLVVAQAYQDELERAADLLASRLAATARPYVLLSGAWADPDDGCLHAVATRLAALGCNVRLSEHAARLHDQELDFPTGRPDQERAPAP